VRLFLKFFEKSHNIASNPHEFLEIVFPHQRDKEKETKNQNSRQNIFVFFTDLCLVESSKPLKLGKSRN